MKLTSDVLGKLMNAVTVGRLMGITELAMEENDKGVMFRGMSDIGGTPTVMLQDIDIELPFTGLGIPDTGSYIVKEKLAKDSDASYDVFAQIDSMTNNVKTLDFRGGRFKMAINTAKTALIRAPKAIKDIDGTAFELDETEINTLTQAVKAFSKAELIDIICDGENISMEIKSGEDGGTFNFELSNDPVFFGEDLSFVHSYPMKTFLNMIKHSESNILKIGQQGILNGNIQGVTMYIFPRRM